MKPTKILIAVQDRFSAIHQWSSCPHVEVGFLEYPHRHEFHVTLKMEVAHNNRELEFLIVKKDLNDYLQSHCHGRDLKNTSCEMLAQEIANAMNIDYPNRVAFVSVSEDGENSAELYF